MLCYVLKLIPSLNFEMRQSTLKLLVKLTSLKHSIHFLYHFTILGWSQHEHSWWSILWCFKHVSDRSHNSYTNKYILYSLVSMQYIHIQVKGHIQKKGTAAKNVFLLSGDASVCYLTFFFLSLEQSQMSLQKCKA